MSAGQRWLMVGGWLNVIGAALHVGCIIGGAEWYRFFGGGDDLAVLAEQGSSIPALLTSVIVALLMIAAAYAFSGAGRLPRLPLLRTALITITAIYMLRALALVPILFMPAILSPFAIWSSLIVLGFGLAHLIGLRRQWPELSPSPVQAV